MMQLNGGPGNTSGMERHKGGATKAELDAAAKKLLAKALKVDQRMFDSPNWEQEVRLRHIMHDAGVYNSYAGFDEKTAIDMAKQDYDSAWEKSIKKDGHLDMKKWMQERMRIAKSRDAEVRRMIRMEIDAKEGSQAGTTQYKAFQKYRGQSGERFRPTSNLIGEFRARAGEFGGISLFDSTSDKLFKNGIEGTVSEHTARRSLWRDTRGKVFSLAGNLGMAMLGEKEINQLTNELNRGTRGVVPDMLTMTNKGVDLKRKWNATKGIGTNKKEALAFLKRAILGMVDRRSGFRPNNTMFAHAALNEGGQVPGKFAQKLFGGGKAMFLGMPRTIKQVEAQRAAKAAMEKASQAVKYSRFSKTPVTDYDGLLEPTSGRSFPVPGIGGVYSKGGDKVFVKPVLDERAALAELRATEIARDVHGLQTPNQRVVVMRDPTDPTGVRRILALESKYNPAIANQDGKFTTDQYFRQLVASSLRGDKDLGRGNLSGNILADVGTAGVFSTASGDRSYSATMPSFKHQAMVNLMGVKGSGAKKFFAESTAGIPKGMTADQYNDRMLKEINEALPKLKQTIGRFDLNSEEKVVYNAMIQRLSDARRQTYGDLHGVHSSLKMSPEKTMTPAAIAKMLAADELKRRQKGHSVSLSDNSFKTSANGFMAGGMIGNILKGRAMHRIGAGFGPTGAPKPSTYESAPWGVNSLSIEMADKLFANTGLRKHTQKLFYDKFAAALAKERPYGYVKDAQGSLKNALEPDVLDSVIRSAASDMISDRAVLSKLSPIDKDILRQKYLNWDSKKDTPLTASLKKIIFGLEGREKGGPVSANTPYVVGEKGPELFVPRNTGGIVPNGYNAGGMIKMMLMQLLGYQGGSMLGGMTGLPGGSMIGGMLGGMLGMGGMGGGGAGVPITSKGKYTRPMGQTKIDQSFSPDPDTGERVRMLTARGAKMEAYAASTNKLKNFASLAAKSLTRLNLAVGVVSVALAIGINRYKAHNEHLRIGMLQYGLTEEAAKKAGLKFTDYNSKLADTVKNIEALKERNQMLYESMQDAGLPISMTIEEYKKLKKEVKETYTDQIKLINQSKESELPQVAIDIKTALMAAGMSADAASKKIFTMFKLSDKAEKAGMFTVGNRAFKNIKTGQDAAEAAVNNYVPASAQGGREGAAAVNTGLNAIQAGIIDSIEKSKKAAKADKTGNTKVLTEYQAQEAMLKKLNSLESSKAILTAKTRAEMIKQNPEIKKIINPMDTVVSLFEKMSLGAKGFTGDLSQLGAEAVSALSKAADSISASVAATNKEGLLKKNYANLKTLTDQQKVLMAAAKGQSAQKQIDTKNELKRLQSQIDANNKLADARLKALDAAKQEGDIAREIAKEQANYAAAEATGNTAGMQQSSLNIQGLQSNLQYNSQKKAIEDSTKLANAPLEARIKAINAGQDKMSDNAAIAAESLDKLNKKIATEKQKIDDVNQAMTALELGALAAKKSLDDFAKTSEGQGLSAGVVGTVNTAVPGKIKSKQPTHPKARLTPESVTDQALGVMGGVSDAVTKGLSANGITVDKMTGDIYINKVKTDVGPVGSTPKQTSLVVGPTKNLSLGSVKASGIKEKQGSYIGQEFLDKYGVKYKIVNDRYGQIQVEKAGYGTMKLNPKVPTIVGDRGPELAFGGMVIPNMAKIPFSSPRYDVNQASKMFEPMRDAKSSNATMSGATINITNNINGFDGDINQLSRMVTQQTVSAIKTMDSRTASTLGPKMNVSIKT